MKKLVIHADDFGLSDEINQGILTAIQKGPVTSTSLLVNFPASRDALSLAKNQNLDLGWHINLTEGRPLSRPEEIPSLVQGDGSFHALKSLIWRSFWRSLDRKDIETELQAQLQTFLSVGIVPTHIDGHEHIHLMPTIREVVQKIAFDHKIPFVRITVETGGITVPRLPARLFLRMLARSCRFGTKKPISFYGLGLGGCAGEIAAWERLLQRIATDGVEVAEIMVHPGLPSADEKRLDLYPGDRYQEWELLMSPQWKSLIQKTGFQLTSFRELD